MCAKQPNSSNSLHAVLFPEPIPPATPRTLKGRFLMSLRLWSVDSDKADMEYRRRSRALPAFPMSQPFRVFQFLTPTDRSDATRNDGSTKIGLANSKSTKKSEAGALPSRITCQQWKPIPRTCCRNWMARQTSESCRNDITMVNFDPSACSARLAYLRHIFEGSYPDLARFATMMNEEKLLAVTIDRHSVRVVPTRRKCQ